MMTMRGSVVCCCCRGGGSGVGTALPTPSLFVPSASPRSPSLRRAQSISVSTADPEVRDEASTAPLTRRRRLILLRHADSRIGDRFTKDHDRPISKVGRKDAISISSKLQQLGWIPELVLSSDSTRTKETLQIMQEHAQGFSEAEVYFVPSFYSIAAMDGQTAEHLQKAICEYSRDEILTVMCMGHNRGWEEAASMLSGATVELKTCNAALLEATGNSWDEYQEAIVVMLSEICKFGFYTGWPWGVEAAWSSQALIYCHKGALCLVCFGDYSSRRRL